MTSTVSSQPNEEIGLQECPSREWVLQYLQAAPDDEHLSGVGRHIDTCRSCQQLVDELTSVERWGPMLAAFSDSSGVERASATPQPTNSEWVTLAPGKDQSTDDIPQLTVQEIVPDNGNDPTRFAALRQRFSCLKSIGRGGCATVYSAVDQALNRTVALKFPHPALIVDPMAQRRFVTELRAAASLHHPNIVAVFDAGFGEHHGFIVFEYVTGPTLGRWLESHTVPVEHKVAASIVAELAEGVHHAHEQGIIHRDLKPSNVLLDESHSRNGLPFTPKISDFGIARVLDSDQTLTADHHIVGSPSYMAPEQAAGNGHQIGRTTDVYSLGVILYQLLTGRLPIEGSGVAEIVRRVISDEPVAPHRHRRDMPLDLEAICLRCLAKDASGRYSTAAALAEDLRRFLAGERISARRPNPWQTFVRTLRRHPQACLLTGSAVASVLVIIGLLLRHNSEQQRLSKQIITYNQQLKAAKSRLELSLTESQIARDSARRNERNAREMVYAADMHQAFEAADAGDARRVHTLLRRHSDGSPLADYRGSEWYYLWRRTQPTGRRIATMPQAVYMTAFSPDRKTLAIAGKDAIVRLLSWPDGTRQAEWPTAQREVNGVTYSPDGHTLWTAGDDGLLKRWDVKSQRRELTVRAHVPELAYEVLYDDVRGLLVSCGSDSAIRLWDPDTGVSRGQLNGHSATVDTIQLHPDGRRLVSTSVDHTVRVWNLDSLECETVIDVEPARPRHCSVSPDARWLAFCTPEPDLHIYDLQQERRVLSAGSLNELMRVCFDDHGIRLFTADKLGVIEIWMANTDASGEVTWKATGQAWQAHNAQLNHLRWSTEDRELISAAQDGSVVAWKDPGVEPQGVTDLEFPEVRDFVFVPGVERLLVACETGLVTVLASTAADPADSANRVTIDDGSDWNHVAVSADGQMIAGGSTGGSVGIWRTGELASNRRIQVFADDGVHSLSFTPDSRHVWVTARGSGNAMLVDTETGKLAVTPASQFSRHAVYSADGGRFATEETETSLQVLDWRSQVVHCRVPPPSLFGETVEFSPDGQKLAVADERRLRIHDATTGELLQELLGHDDRIGCVAFAGDGKSLASVSGGDRTVKLWHVATGQSLVEFQLEDGITFASARCRFSHDQRWFAFQHNADRIRILRWR